MLIKTHFKPPDWITKAVYYRKHHLAAGWFDREEVATADQDDGTFFLSQTGKRCMAGLMVVPQHVATSSRAWARVTDGWPPSLA
jgi:hypothetical protein